MIAVAVLHRQHRQRLVGVICGRDPGGQTPAEPPPKTAAFSQQIRHNGDPRRFRSRANRAVRATAASRPRAASPPTPHIAGASPPCAPANLRVARALAATDRSRDRPAPASAHRTGASPPASRGAARMVRYQPILPGFLDREPRFSHHSALVQPKLIPTLCAAEASGRPPRSAGTWLLYLRPGVKQSSTV